MPNIRTQVFVFIVLNTFFAQFIIVFPAASDHEASKVAIIDSGCNIKYEQGVSFVDDSPADLNGHGTIVAKLIKEINPNAKLYVAKVFAEDSRNIDSKPLVKGIRWAISHEVDIINLSLEIRKDDEAIRVAIQEAFQKGIILVAAAGNNGEFLGVLMDELCKYSEKCKAGDGQIERDAVKYPARYAEVIAVGSVKGFWRFKKPEDYSPRGPEIEFVCTGSYDSQSGTSFAAARATGLISRVKSHYHNVKGEELRNMLKQYALDLGDKGRDIKYGYGRLVYLDVSC